MPSVDSHWRLSLLDSDTMQRQMQVNLAPDSKTQPEIAVSQDGRWIAAGDDGGNLRVWDLTQPQSCHRFAGVHIGPIVGLTWGGDGRFLASIGEDKWIHVWEFSEYSPATP